MSIIKFVFYKVKFKKRFRLIFSNEIKLKKTNLKNKIKGNIFKNIIDKIIILCYNVFEDEERKIKPSIKK